MGFCECAAKSVDGGNRPGISVVEHCRNVAAVAQALLQHLPAPLCAQLREPAVSAAALHDVGKVSPGFQLKYFRPLVSELAPNLATQALSCFETDHARVGASAVWRHLGNPFECPSAVQVIASHHGSIREDPVACDTKEIFGGSAWSHERAKLIEELETEYGRVASDSLAPVIRNCVAGLVTVADWLGSDETFFPACGLPTDTTPSQAASEAVETCGLRNPRIRPGLGFKEIFGYEPYSLQTAFADSATGPGLFILEAPMGMGKTEAALFAAYRLMCDGHNSGLFFGLPTRLTSDRIHERVGAFLQRICLDGQSAKLAHGTAWLTNHRFNLDRSTLRSCEAWFNSRKRALLHPFVVGTIDQALMSVLRVKHHFVRTFALAGKVVILDEVHSYDSYTGTIMDAMAKELVELGCTVIILSATLTQARRAVFFSNSATAPESKGYPQISFEIDTRVQAFPHIQPSARDYTVRMADWASSQVAADGIAKARSGHCTLLIANSVARAQEWYDAVSAERHGNEFAIGLLHSKFPAFRRAELEKQWMRMLGKPGNDCMRPNGCILVATQVVEQSVDIDADFLITELCPTDMLLQRMGRQWRHDRDMRPCTMPETVIVTGNPDAAESADDLIEAFGTVNSKVYSPYVLWRSHQVWRQRTTVKLPGDIRDLLESTYAEAPSESPAVCELRMSFEAKRDDLQQKAQANLANVGGMPTKDDHEGIATRYSDLPTTQVVLATRIDSTGHQAEIELLNGKTVHVDAFQPDIRATKALYKNLVTVATYHLEKTRAVRTPQYLARHFFEPTPVLVWDSSTGELSMDGKTTVLQYRHELGILRARSHAESETPRRYHSDYDEYDVFDKTQFDW